MNKNDIFIIHLTNYKEMTLQLLESADMASAMVGAQMGMAMGSQITQSLQGNMGVQGQPGAASGNRPNFCPNCGTKTGNGNFCSNCGMKLV